MRGMRKSLLSPVTHQGLQLGTVDGELDEGAVGDLERNRLSVWLPRRALTPPNPDFS